MVAAAEASALLADMSPMEIEAMAARWAGLNSRETFSALGVTPAARDLRLAKLAHRLGGPGWRAARRCRRAVRAAGFLST